MRPYFPTYCIYYTHTCTHASKHTYANITLHTPRTIYIYVCVCVVDLLLKMHLYVHCNMTAFAPIPYRHETEHTEPYALCIPRRHTDTQTRRHEDILICLLEYTRGMKIELGVRC